MISHKIKELKTDFMILRIKCTTPTMVLRMFYANYLRHLLICRTSNLCYLHETHRQKLSDIDACYQ